MAGRGPRQSIVRRLLRLDLFYVQNWTLTLDLMILLGTVDHIVLRPLFKVLYRREDAQRKQAELEPALDDGIAVA